MDLFLIIITVVIVMGIAYVLSRPFANPKPVLETPRSSQDYQQQYQNLLKEIKILQDDCETVGAPEEICNQIEEKKQLAADLLRLINEPIQDQLPPKPVNEPLDPQDTQPEAPFLRDHTYICPRCGGRVASSDKFCTHCGNQLQP